MLQFMGSQRVRHDRVTELELEHIFLAALSSTNHDMDIPNNIYATGLKLNTELLLKE